MEFLEGELLTSISKLRWYAKSGWKVLKHCYKVYDMEPFPNLMGSILSMSPFSIYLEKGLMLSIFFSSGFLGFLLTRITKVSTYFHADGLRVTLSEFPPDGIVFLEASFFE